MWLKVSLVVVIFVYYSESFYYDKDQIKLIIEKSLGCLQKQDGLANNATFQTALAYSLITYLIANSPNISPEDKEFAIKIKNGIQGMITTSFENNCYDPAIGTWWSEYYGSRSNYTFALGKVNKIKKLNQTLADVVKNANERTECMVKQLEDNPPSPVLRYCTSDCFDRMKPIEYDYEVSVDERLFYTGYLMINNCSNFSPEEYSQRVGHFCSYTLEEMKVMGKYRNTLELRDVAYYYFSKFVFCASFGVQETISPHLVAVALQLAGCDGCVASHLSKDDMTASTGLALATYISVYRYLIQYGY